MTENDEYPYHIVPDTDDFAQPHIACVEMQQAGDEVELANANVLAAAPELLDELEDAVDSIRQLYSGEWEPDDETLEKAVAKHEAIIAKARGK
ncbi:hypothetical protein C5Y93_05040 [Blastopirellula marina]|uniref:Uncharacterized protein n=2 Tax=Blastopirellula marina TaxID=124 RepID=A0A2S8GSL1_9BACT|nr:hypothetical protein C5Y93_05040 [Blastopirellula marina]